MVVSTCFLRRQLPAVKNIIYWSISRRLCQRAELPLQEYVRNIGIIAHVDAGKTTTTERMLYYAGCTERLGNVDRGDTIMDFLEEERERGITINSAAISFRWRTRNGAAGAQKQQYFVNLIDTPGHVDFAVEVERSLFVLDGAVVILDASAGVEAQTLSVTRRAKSYKLPLIAFLNKLDKPTANVQMCTKAIQQQLGISPLLLQLPIFDVADRHSIVGVVDLLKMNAVHYNFKADTNGSVYVSSDVPENLKTPAQEARRHLVESVAHIDDSFAEKFLAIEDACSPTLNSQLSESVVNVCQKGIAMPVFVGSSLRNVGVQPLLDGIVNHLPSPVTKKHDVVKVLGGDSASSIGCGLIFKTVHDKQKGHLAYCRLYSGSIKRGTSLFLSKTVGTDLTSRVEKVLRVYKIMADELQEIEEAEWGGIVAISGLKQAATGMLLTTRKLEESEINALSAVMPLSRLHIPPPVFSCTIEAESSSQQALLESALHNIVREDPSLTLNTPEDGTPLVISGLGELHLEIVKHRLEKECKVKTLFGPLQIAYVEAISQPARRFFSDKVTVGGQTFSLAFDVELRPAKRQQSDTFPDVQVIKSGKDSQIEFIKHVELKALNLGLESAGRAGPVLRYPVQSSFECRLYAFAVTPGTSMAVLTSSFSKAVRSLLVDAVPMLLEPYMLVEVQVEKPFLSGILSDLAGRQAVIESVVHPIVDQSDEATDNRVFVRCRAPLRLLRGYATAARVLASGRISLAMELANYEPVATERDLDTIRSEVGFVMPSTHAAR